MLNNGPARVKRFWELVDLYFARLEGLRKTKGGDYNKVASFLDYVPLGARDCGAMLWKHCLRFLQFHMSPGAAPNHETALETDMDIGNYAAYHWAMQVLEEEERREAQRVTVEATDGLGNVFELDGAALSAIGEGRFPGATDVYRPSTPPQRATAVAGDRLNTFQTKDGDYASMGDYLVGPSGIGGKVVAVSWLGSPGDRGAMVTVESLDARRRETTLSTNFRLPWRMVTAQ
jgi:hypothetical protein